MKMTRRLVRRVLVVTIVAEAVFCVCMMGYGLTRQPARSESTPFIVDITQYKRAEVIPEKTVVGSPVRLQIPKIAVDAALDYVGLTAHGALESPKGPTNAAWFSLGPRPGAVGNAVIDGHFGYKNNLPAVFDNLHRLQKGDSLYVGDDRGKTFVFVVRELRTYGPHDDARDVFRSTDSKVHLNLITCQGDWHEAQQSFSNRLVVFADLQV